MSRFLEKNFKKSKFLRGIFNNHEIFFDFFYFLEILRFLENHMKVLNFPKITGTVDKREHKCKNWKNLKKFKFLKLLYSLSKISKIGIFPENYKILKK